jgi:hypothetical protein
VEEDGCFAFIQFFPDWIVSVVPDVSFIEIEQEIELGLRMSALASAPSP